MVKIKDVSMDILKLLEESMFGLSIAKLALKLDCSRTTINKYLTILESENKVFAQDIGQYKIWRHKASFLKNKTKREALTTFYEPFYSSLIKNLPQIGIQEQEIKKLGKFIAKDLKLEEITQDLVNDPLIQNMFANTDFLKSLMNVIMKIIDNLCGTFDEYIWNPPILVNKETTFILRMKDSDFVDLPAHFHLLAGIIEQEMTKYQKVKVDINQIIPKEKIVDFKFEILL